MRAGSPHFLIEMRYKIRFGGGCYEKSGSRRMSGPVHLLFGVNGAGRRLVEWHVFLRSDHCFDGVGSLGVGALD